LSGLTITNTLQIQTLSPEELASNAEAGSADCYEEIVRRYSEPLTAFVNKRVRNRQDAEDLVQDTFIRAHDRLHQFNDQYSFKTWLFTIAARLSYSYYRKKIDLPIEEIEIVDKVDPATVMSQREDQDNLWQKTRRILPENQATALWLRYGEGLTVKEIAKKMKKTQVHAKVLLHRGRSRLAQTLTRDQTAQGGTR
jgi:RNA polymerase sigma-70 factor (ECF subfamily)